MQRRILEIIIEDDGLNDKEDVRRYLSDYELRQMFMSIDLIAGIDIKSISFKDCTDA